MRIQSPIVIGIGAVLVGACSSAGDAPAPTDTVHSNLVSLVTVTVPRDLADEDPTIDSDARELAAQMEDVVELISLADVEQVRIDYVGKGRSTDGIAPMMEVDADDPAQKEAATLSSSDWNVYLPATGNVFRVSMGELFLQRMGDAVEELGLNQGSGVGDPEDSDSTTVEKGWSTNFDNRSLLHTPNTAVTNSTWRRIGHMSNSCTGTLIGARHVITAAHCVQGFGTSTYNNFTIRFGRSGSSWNASASTNASPVWTPAGWTNGTTPFSAFDIALVALPTSPGNTEGTMGWMKLQDPDINSFQKYRRGYPVCTSVVGGVNRIDDPADPTPAAGSGSNLTSCTDFKLYGLSGTCTVGNATSYATVAGESWARSIDHNCDGTFGDSGSPVYALGNGLFGSGNGVPYVMALESASICGAFATSTACTSSTTYASRTLRITNEYFSAIGAFVAANP